MKINKKIQGYIFLIIGIVTSLFSIYLLNSSSVYFLSKTANNFNLEIYLLLLFSILLSYSGYLTVKKEYKNKAYTPSDILDD